MPDEDTEVRVEVLPLEPSQAFGLAALRVARGLGAGALTAAAGAVVFFLQSQLPGPDTPIDEASASTYIFATIGLSLVSGVGKYLRDRKKVSEKKVFF